MILLFAYSVRIGRPITVRWASEGQEGIKALPIKLIERNALWEQLFAKVPLKEGIDRAEAFELIVLALDYFDEKFLAEMTAESENQLDEQYVQSFLARRRRFLDMIRYGIEG